MKPSPIKGNLSPQERDEKLEELGKVYATLFQATLDAWNLGMKFFRLSSPEYKALCRTGKRIQAEYNHLITLACIYEWPEEKMNTVFPIRTYCAFN